MSRRRELMAAKGVSNIVLWESINESFTGGYLSTLQPVCDSDKDFTIAIDITINTNPTSGNASEYRLVRIIDGTAYAVALFKNTAASSKLTFMYMKSQNSPTLGTTAAGRHRFVITHTAESGFASIQYRFENGEVETASVTKPHTNASANVILGQSSGAYQLPPGTLNHGIIYGNVLSQADINHFLGV